MADNPRQSGGFTRTIMDTARAAVCFQRCRLVRVDVPGNVREYTLEDGDTVVGSAPECDIVVNEKTVSRRHFAVGQRDQSYVLQDLGSTNGTQVDDVRVAEAFLTPGALIRAGDAYFRFELAYVPEAPKPSAREHFGRLLGRTERMREIFSVLEKVAPTRATVLIQGETGTGKGAVARAIHEASEGAAGPFVVFDCSAVAANLIESELFGHEKGAFTGAVAQRKGALEAASGGTLFIDELAELSRELQPKLLRALEEREFVRVGSHNPIQLNCRVLAASQYDLWREVLDERFRRDLYFRLAVVTIPLPRLAERTEDVPLLVNRFLEDIGDPTFRTFDGLPEEVRARLLEHDWPGNARELRNAIERVCVMGGAVQALTGVTGPLPEISPDAPTSSSLDNLVDWTLPYKDAKDSLLAVFEKEYVSRLLTRTGRNISRAADEAGVGRKHLYSLMAKHEIEGRAGSDGDSGDDST